MSVVKDILKTQLKVLNMLIQAPLVIAGFFSICSVEEDLTVLILEFVFE